MTRHEAKEAVSALTDRWKIGMAATDEDLHPQVREALYEASPLARVLIDWYRLTREEQDAALHLIGAGRL
ncbi:hypothetical protein [Labrys sp. (in: a-proteobacteria)]|uniref:hypothetical protein n=1 Tax=Labrys sp. (in: a-proteobacteria) TaxID=1917972 RepID=UPI0039E5714A